MINKMNNKIEDTLYCGLQSVKIADSLGKKMTFFHD